MAGLSSLLPVFIIVICGLSLPQCQAARVLCVSHQFGSHMLMVHTIAEGLIEHGHEVYTIFSDRMQVPKGLEEKGFKVLRYHTPDNSGIMTVDASSKDMVESMIAAGNNKDHLKFFSNISLHECIDMDNDLTLSQQLAALKFDLIIVDVYALGHCLQFVALKLNVPFVVSSGTIHLELSRSPVLPSFHANELSLFSEGMNFFERIQNTYYTILINTPSVNQWPGVTDISLVTKYAKASGATTWIEVTRTAELFFTSRGHMLESPAPLMPNLINVECLTCKFGKPLPSSIGALIDKTDSIIVVSFGSFIDDFPDHVSAKIAEAFSKRKELIFWRFSGKLPVGVPDNVKLMKWLPQNDLLAHLKTKLFITHSGNNGQYESVYHGVPMLAFPIFAEQPHNAVRIVKHGFGLQINVRSFTSEELVNKMSEIIENPSYREKTQKVSRIMKSSAMDAQERAIYWIEHVLEFGGDHLRSHGLKMPWYSFYMLDILLFVEAVVVGFIIASVCVCSFVVRRMCASPRKKQKQN